MSNKTKHRKLNPLPTVTFYGDPIDRLLNGGFTDELRRQLPKEKEGAKANDTPLLIPSDYPLRAIFFQNHCRCGSTQTVFGYFCRKVIEQDSKLGEVTRYKVVEPNGKPEELLYQPQIVPFCSKCIPMNVIEVKE